MKRDKSRWKKLPQTDSRLSLHLHLTAFTRPTTKKQVAILHPNKYFSIIRKYSHLFLQDTDSPIKREIKTCQAFLRSLLLQVPLDKDVVYCVFKAFIGAGLKQFDTLLDDRLPVLLLVEEAAVPAFYLMSSRIFRDTCADGFVPSTCRPVTSSHGRSPL